MKATTTPLAALYKALHAAANAVEPVEATAWCASVPKRSARPHEEQADGFWFAPLATIRAAARPALLENGLLLTLAACIVEPTPLDRDLRADLRFELIHGESNGVLVLPMRLPVSRPGDFVDVPMAVAATVSHGWRIILQQLLCIEVVMPGAKSAAQAARNVEPTTYRCRPAPGAEASAEPPAWEPSDPEASPPAPPMPVEQFSPTGLSDLLGAWCDREETHALSEGRPRPHLTLADAWQQYSGEAPSDPPRVLTVLEQEQLYFWLSEAKQRAEWIG